LKGQGNWKPPEAWVFETGTNQWRKYDSWPPKQAQTAELRLERKGHLTLDTSSKTPSAEALSRARTAGSRKLSNEEVQNLSAKNGDDRPTNSPGFDEFISDPAHPVPYFDRTSIGMEKEYMVADQRFAAHRPDVVVYQTEPLKEDFTIAGPVEVALTVATTGTDSDWVAKLIDVYPDDASDPEPNPALVRMGGYQQLVRGDVMRGKFRNSYEKPEPFEPNKPTTVKFTMNDTCHTFRQGHRIMIQVQSSWFPLVDRNPQTFCDIYHAKDSDFQKATNRIYHSGDKPSVVTVKVVK
jgi:putative CocE/NonD family hydrolase